MASKLSWRLWYEKWRCDRQCVKKLMQNASVFITVQGVRCVWHVVCVWSWLIDWLNFCMACGLVGLVGLSSVSFFCVALVMSFQKLEFIMSFQKQKLVKRVVWVGLIKSWPKSISRHSYLKLSFLVAGFLENEWKASTTWASAQASAGAHQQIKWLFNPNNRTIPPLSNHS